MQKRGQVTVFIIIGIAILILFGVFFYIKSTAVKIDLGNEETFSVEPVKLIVEDCFEDTSKEALLILGLRGGDIYLKNPYIIPAYAFSHITTFAYTNGKITLPNFLKIKNSLEDFVENRIIDCVDFKIFKGVKVKTEDPKVTFEFGEVTLVKMEWSIKVQKGETVKEINSFDTRHNTRIKKVYETVTKITEYQIARAGAIDMNFLNNLEISDIDVVRRDNVVLFMLRDSVLNEPKYHFLFAFDNSEFIEEEVLPPIIGPLPILYGSVGGELTQKLDITDPQGLEVELISTDPLFTFDGDSIKGFLHETHLGTNEFEIIATNSEGIQSIIPVTLVVEE